jgi:hypothetical protein
LVSVYQQNSFKYDVTWQLVPYTTLFRAATANVRAAPFPLFSAVGMIDAHYPVGPTAGVAWNLTLMSYNGSLDMGLNVDAGAVDDPELLRDLIEAEFAALLEAGAPKPARKRATKKKAAG